MSKIFSISQSSRQGCPVAQILYILQAEPMACAIRGTDEMKGIKMPRSENVLESKICMFADDFLIEMKNQLNRLIKFYEKASGSKINYEKTKELFIGRLRSKHPRFTKMSWVTDNIRGIPWLRYKHRYCMENNNKLKFVFARKNVCLPPSHKL